MIVMMKAVMTLNLPVRHSHVHISHYAHKVRKNNLFFFALCFSCANFFFQLSFTVFTAVNKDLNSVALAVFLSFSYRYVQGSFTFSLSTFWHAIVTFDRIKHHFPNNRNVWLVKTLENHQPQWLLSKKSPECDRVVLSKSENDLLLQSPSSSSDMMPPLFNPLPPGPFFTILHQSSRTLPRTLPRLRRKDYL